MRKVQPHHTICRGGVKWEFRSWLRGKASMKARSWLPGLFTGRRWISWRYRRWRMGRKRNLTGWRFRSEMQTDTKIIFLLLVLRAPCVVPEPRLKGSSRSSSTVWIATRRRKAPGNGRCQEQTKTTGWKKKKTNGILYATRTCGP